MMHLPHWLEWWTAAMALLSCAYALLMHRYRSGWLRLPEFEPVPLVPSETPRISVLIPARDEADNILPCLQSILRQSYPPHQFEIIVIDDHSTDLTPDRVRHFAIHHPRVRLLSLADLPRSGLDDNVAFKKQAITAGVRAATGELIATTDADCIVPENWLALLAACHTRRHARFIAAPVCFFQEKNLLERFQSLDFIGMMGITGAGFHHRSHLMCNGANLAYTRQVFFDVDGFNGVDHLASGDDMFLLHKVARRWPRDVHFLKHPGAVVKTTAKPDLPSFFSQRIRWATKSAAYRDRRVTAQLTSVFLFCWGIVLSAALAGVAGQFPLLLASGMLLVKCTADYRFLSAMTRYFGRNDLLRSFPAAQIFHLLYILAVGTYANLVRQYEWKGRKVR
ncbi:MAG: hypothetical protein RLY31_2247 [Bacteroidota bacterium]|jgi:cellulose synthase/poly-beta-1,6-N-acetylglucosamine synthase-like glycosyltransferase